MITEGAATRGPPSMPMPPGQYRPVGVDRRAGLPQCAVMGCLQHRGLDPGGVVELGRHPGWIQLASIEQLDGNRVERLISAQRTPCPRPEHPPPLVSDQPLLTNPALHHELRVATHHPARGSRLPERVRVPVVGHQHRHDIAPWPQIRRDVVPSYRSRRGCDRIGPRPTSAALTHNTYRESADRRSGTRGGTSSTSNTRRKCARENSAGGRSEPTLVGSITNSGTSGATQ
jgi:hypothetical protein